MFAFPTLASLDVVKRDIHLKWHRSPLCICHSCVLYRNCLPFSTVIQQPPKYFVQDLCILRLFSGDWAMCCCCLWHVDFKGKKSSCPTCSHPLILNGCSARVYAICLLVLFVFYRFGMSDGFIKDNIKSSWDHWELSWPTLNQVKEETQLKTAERSTACLALALP